MLAETAARAASQHEVYQELMYPPGGREIDALAKSVGWDDDFGRLEQKLIAGGSAKDPRRRRAQNFGPTKPDATRSCIVVLRRPTPAARSSSGFSTRSRVAKPRSWCLPRYSPAS